MLDRAIYILLADDDDDDRFVFEEATSNIQLNITIEYVENGVELMKKLQANLNNLPDVIFLDLNMPLKSGFECLQEIKNHPDYKHIPVIIYSTSSNLLHIEKTYADGANLCISKPDSISILEKVVNDVLRLDCRNYKPQPNKDIYVFKY